MKLIKAYVRGFGNIVNTKIDFTKNIYEICEDNGYGKSTIAHFIKAMFYGFETTRKNDSNITDRKKFLPFNSSAYGGSLDFEYQGHLYHVDRVFGNKNKKEVFSQRRIKSERLSSLRKDLFYKCWYVQGKSLFHTGSLFCG